MKNQKVLASRNARTGSYTVRTSKSAATGRFVAESQTSRRTKVERMTTPQGVVLTARVK